MSIKQSAKGVVSDLFNALAFRKGALEASNTYVGIAGGILAVGASIASAPLVALSGTLVSLGAWANAYNIKEFKNKRRQNKL